MNESTLLFLMDGDQILLAMKKRGFGVGRWNGVGGKLLPGETIEEAACRECHEEIGVLPISYRKVARLYFYFADKPSSERLCVTAYTCTKWEGEPYETEEMAPQWFAKKHIPYDLMWPDDRYWLSLVLQGQFVYGNFWFDSDERLISRRLRRRPLITAV